MAFDHAMSVKLQIVNEQTATPAMLSSIADSIRKAALILVLATLNVWGANTVVGQNSNEATPKGQTFRGMLNVSVEFDFNQDQNGQYSLHVQSLKPKLTKGQREKAIQKAILYQLQEKNIEPAFKKALEKYSPNAVERLRWTQNTSAQELLNRFELMNNTQEGDLTGGFEKRMDSSEAKDFVFSLAVDSKDEQEFNQVIGNYLKFNMVRAIISASRSQGGVV